MTDERSPFYAYRYLVSPIKEPPRQISLFDVIEFDLPVDSVEQKTKEELMLDVFNDLNKEIKTPFVFGKKRFIIYSKERYKKRLFAFQFAKEQTERKSVEGETSIETKDDFTLRHVLFFVHFDHQIILMERKTTAFPHTSTAIRILERYLRDRMRHFKYTVNIYPLSNPEKFWETVESADAIYDLSLTLNAPNIFGGSEDLRELVREIKELTNNDQTTIEVKSADGNLEINKSFWGRFIDYIATIGGRYVLRVKKGDVVERKSNEDTAEKVHIVRHQDKDYSDDELADVEKKVELIDQRSVDKNEDDSLQPTA